MALAPERLEPRLGRLRVFVGHVVDGAAPVRFSVDWPAVARSGRPVTLSVLLGRGIFPYRGPAQIGPAGDLLAAALAEARAAEVKVDALHLEVDCPAGRLGMLADALGPLRSRLGRMPIGVSLYPEQLRDPEAAVLIATADRWTLNLMRGRVLGGVPAAPDDSTFDRWLADAAQFGKPFDLGFSLAAHYRCFDDNGAELAVVLVGIRPPAGTSRVIPLVADPDSAAALLRRAAVRSPALLEGIDWFRLPLPGDGGTWSAAGLTSVLDDHPATRGLVAAVDTDESGLTRVLLTNSGSIPLAPVAVDVGWSAGIAQACDGASGFELLSPGPLGFHLRPSPAVPVVGPGESRAVGWVRFAESPRDLEARPAQR